MKWVFIMLAVLVLVAGVSIRAQLRPNQFCDKYTAMPFGTACN